MDQIRDAQENFGVCDFIRLPQELQKKWSNVPAKLENLDNFMVDFENFVKANAKEGDFALVQGDFGVTYKMIEFCKKEGIRAVYATTKRIAKEMIADGRVVKNSIFKHVRFREY